MHARGGSIALGGGRIDALVRSAPADVVSPVLRIHRAGPWVSQSYGLQPIALRTLERAFSALALSVGQAQRGDSALAIRFIRPARRPSRRPVLAAYRRLVFGEPDFHEYFRQVTPIDVIERDADRIAGRVPHR